MESEAVVMEMHLSEARLTNGITNDGDIIPAGSRGIGGKSDILNMVGIVQLRIPEGRVKRIQCYVFDSPLGPTQKILLLSLQSVIEASINIKRNESKPHLSAS